VESAAGNYLMFLKKRIRENFALEGIPLDIEAVARPKKVESIRRNNPAK
jgi:predicted GTPase